MSKIKIFNLTNQLINLLLKENGKEVNCPLVSKGCIGTTQEAITSDVKRLVKCKQIYIEQPQIKVKVDTKKSIETKTKENYKNKK